MSEPAPDPVTSLVREADFGRYAASLFAPAEVRRHLLALYAFDIELARVRDLVSEPMPGELRLQWWRDALESPERADAISHPVARALEGAIAFGRLPRAALTGLVDARTDDLYDDPIPTMEALEARLGATCSAVLRLAALVAARGRDPGGAEVAGFGGVAQGIARLLRQFPKQVARGQILLPVDLMARHGATVEGVTSGGPGAELALALADLAAHASERLSDARAAYSAFDPAAAPAMLPLALVAPELDRLGSAKDPFRAPAEPARWRALIRLWRASRNTPPF